MKATKFFAGAALIAMAGAIPLGPILAFWTGNGWWWLLCLPLPLFLS